MLLPVFTLCGKTDGEALMGGQTMMVVVLLVVAALAAPAHANLVTNGDFETLGACSGGSHWDSSPDCPSGWSAYSSGDATVEWFQRPADRDQTDPAVRVSLASTPGYKVGQIQWAIPVVPGEQYLFSALVMADDLRSEVLIQAQGRDASGGWLSETLTSPTSKGSFVWKRIQLAVTAPAGAATLAFRLRNQTSGGCRGTLSAGSDCGSVWFDDVEVVEIEEPPSLASGNLCPEGQFLELSTKECLDLQAPGWGYDSSPFDAATVVDYNLAPASCTHAGLAAIIATIASQPAGTFSRLTLPACEIELENWISPPGNLIIQGAGTGKTRIRTRLNNVGGGISAVAFWMNDIRNLVIRDLTIDGERTAGVYPSTNIVAIKRSANVLLERVEIIHSGGTGLVWRNSPNVTIRYSVVTRNHENHGIGCADCEGLSVCPYEADFGEGQFESSEYQILSSWSHQTDAYPVDVHSASGEVAGNLLEGSVLYSGIKAPDAVNLHVRHNRISGNEAAGVLLQVDWRMPDEIFIEDNTIVDNVHDGINAPLGEDIYIRRNYIAGNGFSSVGNLQGVSVGNGWDPATPFNYLRNVTIEGNTFDGNAGFEVRVGPSWLTTGSAHLQFNEYLTPDPNGGEIRLRRPGVTACEGSEEEVLQLSGEVAENALAIVPCN